MQSVFSLEVMCAYLKPELAGRSASCQHPFTCSILAYSGKTLRESSEIFVEHVLHVVRLWFRT